MPLNDVYEITDVQELRGQEVLNVYFYRQNEIFGTTNPTYAQAAAEAWVDQILPAVTAVQSQDVVHTALRVKNLFDASDAFEIVHSIPGDQSNSTSSNFDAIGLQLGGETAAVRKGAKRIAGIPDAAEAAGVITDAGLIAAGADLAEALEAALQIGTLITSPVFLPVLVKRVRSGSPGNYEYRLPENAGETVSTKIINVLFEILLTSQVSRKLGLGS